MALQPPWPPPLPGLDLGLTSCLSWPELHWPPEGGRMCGGTPGGTMAVGILGPGPWPDKGATLGGMACQPPSCLPCPPEGDTWGGMLMVIMSTASLSTPFMSTLPGGPGGGLCPLLLGSGGPNLAGGGCTLKGGPGWPGLGSMLGGGVLYWGWGGATPGLAAPPS